MASHQNNDKTTDKCRPLGVMCCFREAR